MTSPSMLPPLTVMIAAITVPQEAIDAVAAGEAASLDDVAENLVADAETEAAEAATEAVAE